MTSQISDILDELPKSTIKTTKYTKVIPLGGVGEIGKNSTVFETANDIIVVDYGSIFPSEELLGIDLVIPDTTYIERTPQKVKALIITHGHEDHIGGAAYFLQKFNVPVYATALTIGILENRLNEKGGPKNVKLNTVSPGDIIEIGDFKIEFISSNHSIAGSVMLSIDTPCGKILHTGDFKVDFTSMYTPMANLSRLGELGKENVRLLLMDSTNAEIPGKTPSERKIYESFNDMFERFKKERLVFATFSTNTSRIQTILNLSKKYKRKVAIAGRSMQTLLDISKEKGAITIPKNLLVDINDIDSIPKEKAVILTTGSQGEQLSALNRMAISEHKKVKLTKNDIVIISSHPIPGNEKSVSMMINSLLEQGVPVVHDQNSIVHTSGHGCQDDLALVQSLVQPEYFMPIHGETRHLLANKNIALERGMEEKNIFIPKIGRPLLMTESSCSQIGDVPSGKVYVDGAGIGDIGSVVLRDRKILSEDGIVIAVITIDQKKKKLLTQPDIISRGFVYVKESETLMSGILKIVNDEAQRFIDEKNFDWSEMKQSIRVITSKYIFQKTKRNPMILPIIINV